jgi:hypothetical protein
MPGFLSQITAKQRKLMEDIAAKAKTIGIKVEPQLYAQLADAKERMGMKSMKAVAVRACVAGVRVLLEGDARDPFLGYSHRKGDRWEDKDNSRLYVERAVATRYGSFRLTMSNGEDHTTGQLMDLGYVRTKSVHHDGR